MNPLVKNILAVLAGIVVGSIVNGGIITAGGALIPLPSGVDGNAMEGLVAGMPLFEPKHFLMPFLAHALGTLVGAFVAAYIAASRKMTFALVVGALFMLGGIYMVYQLPSPMWFNALDLIVAYIPMAYLGGRLATAKI